jgi:branched-chain amino acid transport system ATP-binding protein
MTTLLDVQGLETSYGRSQVLFGIDLQVGAGEVVGLVGRNGMGKTTTLRSIMGLTPSSGGQVRIGGRDVRGQRTFRIARAGLAIVPEGRQVFRQLTVREHLLMAQSQRSQPAQPWTIERVFALFPRLAEREDHFGMQLSGGEQQMLAIGRALVTNPQLILFDEATEGLAPLIRREIWGAVARMKQEGCAVLVVDKSVNDMALVASRIVVLEKGRVAWQGPPVQLCGNLELQQRYLAI